MRLHWQHASLSDLITVEDDCIHTRWYKGRKKDDHLGLTRRTRSSRFVGDTVFHSSLVALNDMEERKKDDAVNSCRPFRELPMVKLVSSLRHCRRGNLRAFPLDVSIELHRAAAFEISHPEQAVKLVKMEREGG